MQAGNDLSLKRPPAPGSKYRSPLIVLLKVAIFWAVTPCSGVVGNQRFRRTGCLHHHPVI